MHDTNFAALPVSGRRLTVVFSRLQHVVAAADYGSFRQAAHALSITQSTLSRSVQLLEHSIGVVIFERSSGGVRVTPAGRHFLRMTRSILEQIDALIASTRANGSGEAGRLVIGFCTSLTAGNLRATLLDYRKLFPQVELATVERSRTRLATALRNGVIDVCIITGDPQPFDSKTIPLWSERILVVLPNDHPLAARQIIYWTDLRDQTVLLSHYDPGRELEDLLNAKLVFPEHRPRIERHDVSRGVIKSLIAVGFGISLVLESDIGANFSGLVYRELRDGTGPSRIGFSAVWRCDNENPALQNLLKLLGERYPFGPVAP
ncbi:LysR family transcriptional regulator [Bradyrhizobium sp. 200]|uniref:LysR family transcriptional regulator n=1 Tax=Bradyrhizobium sp. 200 TaxID=2782665 RepID=UPI001FFFE391|nr:LysR family transcriptional regulator [Bradyrhizobium sp. 200]UPJ48440.1 LysR family transcriptional regulator [Bradyrhizobium sp. 200]